jgi:outer membrane lipoprotein LolB
MGAGRLGLVCLLASLVAGCAQWPGLGRDAPRTPLALSPAPERFSLEGRVSVKSGESSFSGGMVWDHGPQQDVLLLRTPLGQGVAELHGRPDRVTLKDGEGRVHEAPDAETLVRQTIGMTLPLKGLTWWVVGHPQPGVRHRAEADAQGRLAVLDQADWRIEFSRYAPQGEAGGSAGELPGKLVARRGDDLEIRLVVDSWRLP